MAPNGNDGTAAVGNPTLPYATIAAAVQNNDASFVIVRDGDYDPFSFESTHTGWSSVSGGFNNNVKWVAAENPYRARIRIAGPETHTLTWAPTGPTLYYTTIPGTVEPERFLNRQAFDEFGFEVQLFRFDSRPVDKGGYGSVGAALNALAAANSGWVWDPATRFLYAKYHGADMNAIKFGFRAVYKQATANGLQSVYLKGATLILDGLLLDGVAIRTDLDAASIPPRLWIIDCLSQFSPIAGLEANACQAFSENFRVHASTRDGCQYFPSTGTSLMMEANNHFTKVGAIDTYGTVTTEGTIQQGSSMHGKCSGARFGVISEVSLGANIADVGGGPSDIATYVWHVGVLTRRSRDPSPAGQYFTTDPGPFQRTVWLDTCADMDEGANVRNLVVSGSAAYAAHVDGTNTNYFPTVVGGTPTAYDPRSP
ncbi:MAG TPA: hypothetical protein VF744_16515 [Beijerinckiaceae bacterium]